MNFPMILLDNPIVNKNKITNKKGIISIPKNLSYSPIFKINNIIN